ncbi:sigma-70 RNA polymerase sigma factor region 4 domain-containing protein [Pedobacter namyangjuensis]|uniref:sigma-70 family RNA polymerase sigma factor n=1 Tax=Pedobacter namyangjuensis TaxID=600626 RepID=UPI000DE51C7D|nr:sigma-70 family RNA polymerase sigma factor [Pedobacter namyangjuensis]
MLKGQTEADMILKVPDIRLLYNKYSGMLLGFISQIIDDRSQAEQQMINIFKELAKNGLKNNLTTQSSVVTSWNELRKFALTYLPVKTITQPSMAKPVIKQHLTEQEQQVFNIAYYQKQSVSAIAVQLKQTEDSIRETLKKAFAVMKQNYGN